MPSKIYSLNISADLHAKIKDAANKQHLKMGAFANAVFAYGLERLPTIFPVKMVPIGSCHVPETTFVMIQKEAANRKCNPSEVVAELLVKGLKSTTIG